MTLNHICRLDSWADW